MSFRFTAIQKPNVTNDADPRVTPPSATFIFDADPYTDQGKRIPTASIVLRARVFTNVPALCPDGSVILTLYVFDTVGQIWLKVDSSPNPIANDQVFAIPFPAVYGKTECFVQVTNVVGTGKDHVEIAWSPGGQIPNNSNIAATTGDVSIKDSTTGLLATVKTVGTVNALEVDSASLIAGEDLTNNLLRVRTPATADSTDAWTNYASAAVVGTAGINIKASAGRLRHIIATNKSTTVQYWLLVVNKATAPVANDLPIAAFELPALTGVTIKADGQLDFGPDGLYCSNGISYALSTTSDKVTLAVATDAMVYARYA